MHIALNRPRTFGFSFSDRTPGHSLTTKEPTFVSQHLPILDKYGFQKESASNENCTRWPGFREKTIEKFQHRTKG
jgi:hypothetical protein